MIMEYGNRHFILKFETRIEFVPRHPSAPSDCHPSHSLFLIPLHLFENVTLRKAKEGEKDLLKVWRKRCHLIRFIINFNESRVNFIRIQHLNIKFVCCTIVNKITYFKTIEIFTYVQNVATSLEIKLNMLVESSPSPFISHFHSHSLALCIKPLNIFK